MEERDLFRQLIGHFEKLCELYGSNTTPFLSSSSSSSLRFQQLLFNHPLPRQCFLNLDENLADINLRNVVSRVGKSLNLEISEPHKRLPNKKPRKERNCGRLKLAYSIEDLKQEIWKDFPEDLLEVVIARLPIATFFHFRSVCQKWNSLLSSPSFSHHCARVPQTQPWFYTITHENLATASMYDPSMMKWRHPAIPPPPPKVVILLPVASAGGLICFLDIGHTYFYVCNPLTRTWKELPARSVEVWSRVAVGMLWDRNPSKGYKILWVGHNGEHEIYNSVQNSWTRPGEAPVGIKLPLSLNFRSQAVSIDATIYFLRSDPDGIVSYDLETRVWKQFMVPSPPHSTDYSLAECGGRIMLVGLLTKNAATCVCVWELQRMTLLWKEVDRMPNIWCLEFYGKQVRMSCLGNKGLLMLSLRSRRMSRIVTYDVLKREWLGVPRCIVSRGRKRQWIHCGTAFYPCLIAVP
ncbi:F-box only protein 6-like protein [Drosera capensis]